jgi:hypothetical protein
MFKKILLVAALTLSFVGTNSYSAEPPPTPAPVVPTPTPVPLDDKSVIVVLDGKLVHATDVLNPIVTIEGADNVVGLGELVFLQAKLANELPSFVKAKVFKFSVSKHSYKEDQSLGTCFFGAGITPDKLPVKVDVSLTYQVGNELLIKTTSQTVNVQIGDPKPPDPSPNPIPPAPTLTDNQKAMYDIALNTFGKTLSPDDFKKAAAILASDFSNCSQNITKGQYDSFEAFSNDLRATNQASVALLKLDLSKFDGFRTSLHDFLVGYYAKHGIKTNPLSPNGDESLKILSDWVPLINDMAIGLKAAAGTN